VKNNILTLFASLTNRPLLANQPYKRSLFSRLIYWETFNPPTSKLKYELPETVRSVREGWQWTCQSGAVVSGLLAAVAAQLLGFFKPDANYDGNIHLAGGAKGFLLATCYAALFLNISATISSFILIDNLGEIGFRASCQHDLESLTNLSTITTTQDGLLMKFGASPEWKFMLYHWLVTFYSGIISLIVAVLTYVMMQESFVTKIVMGLLVGFTLLPVTYFIFIRPLLHY